MFVSSKRPAKLEKMCRDSRLKSHDRNANFGRDLNLDVRAGYKDLRPYFVIPQLGRPDTISYFKHHNSYSNAWGVYILDHSQVKAEICPVWRNEGFIIWSWAIKPWNCWETTKKDILIDCKLKQLPVSSGHLQFFVLMTIHCKHSFARAHHLQFYCIIVLLVITPILLRWTINFFSRLVLNIWQVWRASREYWNEILEDQQRHRNFEIWSVECTKWLPYSP